MWPAVHQDVHRLNLDDPELLYDPESFALEAMEQRFSFQVQYRMDPLLCKEPWTALRVLETWRREWPSHIRFAARPSGANAAS